MAKNRRIRHKEKQAIREQAAEAVAHAEIKSRRDAEMRCYGDDPERLPDADLDLGDSGPKKERWLRSTQRKASQIVSLGILPKEQVDTLLKGSFGVIGDAIKRKDPRDARAAWMPIFAAARLEFDYNNLGVRMIPLDRMTEAAPSESGIDESHTTDISVSYMSQPNLDVDSATAAIMEDLGLIMFNHQQEAQVEP